MEESGADEAECSKKVASGRRFVGAIKSLVNVRDFQLECARVLHVPVATYGSETILPRRRRDLELGLYRWTTSKA